MKKEQRKEWIEIFGGGIFGVIAIVSAIIEYSLGDAGTLFGCIKDVSGTLVVVAILIASIELKPIKIVKKLENEVESWGVENSPLIFKVEGFVQASSGEYTQGFALLQNPQEYSDLVKKGLTPIHEDWNKYAAYRSSRTGKFLDLPDYVTMTQKDKFNVCVVLSQSHFSSKNNFTNNLDDIITCINFKKGNIVSASRIGNELKFNLTFNKISKKSDIYNFIDTLDFLLSIVKVIA